MILYTLKYHPPCKQTQEHNRNYPIINTIANNRAVSSQHECWFILSIILVYWSIHVYMSDMCTIKCRSRICQAQSISYFSDSRQWEH